MWIFPLAAFLSLFCAPTPAWSSSVGPLEECDRLAASDLDRGRPATVSGVLFSRIDAASAIAACTSAARIAPSEARIQYQLGRAFHRAMQMNDALKMYSAAVERGSLPAMNELAELLQFGKLVPPDPAGAARLYEKAAAAGLPIAMYNLAVLYRTGQGVPKDENRSQHWFRQARIAFQGDLQLGSASAMHMVGLMHQYGAGGRQDHEQARALFTKAAQLGHPLSPLHLRMLGAQ